MTNDSLALFKGDELAKSWRICEGLAKSTLIPKDFQGKPENVMISVLVAQRFEIDPFTVMQNLAVINGRPSFSTQFLMALANRSGRFVGPIEWESSGSGDTLKVTAWAVLASTNRRVDETVSMALAKAEGWTRNAKYQTMPERMLKYRAASALIGLYASDIKMGFSSEEEAETIEAEAVQPAVAQDEATKELGPAVAARKRRSKTIAAESVADIKDVSVPPANPVPVPAPVGNPDFANQVKAERQRLLALLSGEIYKEKQQQEPNAAKISAIEAEKKEIMLMTDEEVMAYDVF